MIMNHDPGAGYWRVSTLAPSCAFYIKFESRDGNKSVLIFVDTELESP